MNIGDLLNERYSILSNISLKGFRQRWLALDQISNENVVLETLHDDLINNSEAVNNIRYELEVSQKLNNRLFLKCSDTFLYDKKLFLVWQYYDFESLSKFTLSAGYKNISDHKKIELISKIINGLDEANNLGVVHGSLSGENIIVNPSFDPRVINFSQNQVLLSTDPGSNSELSFEHLCAPEVRENQRPDLASDLYSLGMLARILLSNDKSTRLSISRPDLDSSLSASLDALLSSDKEVRLYAKSRIIDESFLDTMRTPPHGTDVIKVSKIKSRRMQKRLRKNGEPSNTPFYLMRVFMIAFAIMLGILLIAILKHYVPDLF